MKKIFVMSLVSAFTLAGLSECQNSNANSNTDSNIASTETETSPTFNENTDEESTPVDENSDARDLAIQKVESFFHIYNNYQSNNFEGLSEFFADEVQTFVYMKNVKPEYIETEVRKFFKNKQYANHAFQANAIKGYHKGDMYQLEVPLSMSWTWNENKNSLTYSAAVKAIILFNKEHKIVSYKEIESEPDTYKVIEDVVAYDSDNQKITIKRGSTLKDAHYIKYKTEEEIAKASENRGNLEQTIYRKVNYKGKTYWVIDVIYFDYFSRVGTSKNYLEKIEEQVL